MHWKRLDRSSPQDGTLCVVGHFVQGCNKPMMGLLKYCYFGDNSYWLTRSGNKVLCHHNDHWCDVKDVMSEVEDMIIDDVMSAIDRQKLMNGDYNF